MKPSEPFTLIDAELPDFKLTPAEIFEEIQGPEELAFITSRLSKLLKEFSEKRQRVFLIQAQVDCVMKLLSGFELRECCRCNKYFKQMKPFRNEKLYCSNACKQAALRERHESAKEMFAEGISVSEIAIKLETSPDKIKKWVGVS